MSDYDNFKGPWNVNDVHYRKINNAWRDGEAAEVAGQGNLTDAWFGGGLQSPSSTSIVSTVDRIIF